MTTALEQYLQSQAAQANMTNIGGVNVSKDRLLSDSRGTWVGPMTPNLPALAPEASASIFGPAGFNDWKTGSTYAADMARTQEAIANSSILQRLMRPPTVQAATPTPAEVAPESEAGTPTPISGPTPTGSQGYYGINYGNILSNMTSAQRRAMGPGNLGPSFRPMMAGAMPQMPQVRMPVFPATMPSPFGAINETLMPGRRDSPGRLGPPPRERPEGTTDPANNPPPGPTNTPEYYSWLRAATPEQLNALDPSGALLQLQRNTLQSERESLNLGGGG